MVTYLFTNVKFYIKTQAHTHALVFVFSLLQLLKVKVGSVRKSLLREELEVFLHV